MIIELQVSRVCLFSGTLWKMYVWSNQSLASLLLPDLSSTSFISKTVYKISTSCGLVNANFLWKLKSAGFVFLVVPCYYVLGMPFLWLIQVEKKFIKRNFNKKKTHLNGSGFRISWITLICNFIDKKKRLYVYKLFFIDLYIFLMTSD